MTRCRIHNPPSRPPVMTNPHQPSKRLLRFSNHSRRRKSAYLKSRRYPSSPDSMFRHYMPATSKVLSIIDKGVRDRVTKNGETLRRHAESAQRWKNLRERITRTDAEMEAARKILLHGDAASEAGSSASGSTHNGYLATPPSGSRGSRTGSSASTLSRSISPFRKFARKITGTTKSPVSPVTPLSVNKNNGNRVPSSEPAPSQTLRRQKTSFFSTLRGTQPPTPSTPDRPGHKHSQSFTPDSSPRGPKVDSTVKGRPSLKQPWNSSTRVINDGTSTVKGTPPKRAPSAAGMYGDVPSVPTMGRRSLSRASMASGRPWSPLTSSGSTYNSTSYPPLPTFRPPSRAQTPHRAQTPSRAPSRAFTPSLTTTPRPRPKTPSHIPAPSNKLLRSISGPQSDSGWDDDDPDSSLMQRAFSPALSTSAMSATSPAGHPPRPPSRSMIPVPTLHLSSPSRPQSTLSNYARAESPSAFKSYAARAQTPESALRARVQQIPFYQGSISRSTGRPSVSATAPPSSFRDGSASRTPSRAGSRNGTYTPIDNLPLHEYFPGNTKDPLDVEVASVVNSISHGLLVERVDPPLKKIPKEGEEIKAQYAFSNALSRKVVTCRLSTLTRAGKSTAGDTTTKKVMCRVGGGMSCSSYPSFVHIVDVFFSLRVAGSQSLYSQSPGRLVKVNSCYALHPEERALEHQLRSRQSVIIQLYHKHHIMSVRCRAFIWSIPTLVPTIVIYRSMP